jgi:hypothetical protein
MYIPDSSGNRIKDNFFPVDRTGNGNIAETYLIPFKVKRTVMKRVITAYKKFSVFLIQMKGIVKRTGCGTYVTRNQVDIVPGKIALPAYKVKIINILKSVKNSFKRGVCLLRKYLTLPIEIYLPGMNAINPPPEILSKNKRFLC